MRTERLESEVHQNLTFSFCFDSSITAFTVLNHVTLSCVGSELRWFQNGNLHCFKALLPKMKWCRKARHLSQTLWRCSTAHFHRRRLLFAWSELWACNVSSVKKEHAAAQALWITRSRMMDQPPQSSQQRSCRIAGLAFTAWCYRIAAQLLPFCCIEIAGGMIGVHGHIAQKAVVKGGRAGTSMSQIFRNRSTWLRFKSKAESELSLSNLEMAVLSSCWHVFVQIFDLSEDVCTASA